MLRTWIVAAVLAGCASRTPDLAPTLRSQTQALLDAVSAGDKAVWERLVDDGASYQSEDGTRETKASLVAQLAPFPAGISGTLTITHFEVHRFGDVAIAVHEDHETEQYFGQSLVADYKMIDTWRRTPSGWRLIATGVYVVGFDPPAIELPAAELDDYAGTYRLNTDITYEIRRDGASLVAQKGAGKPQALKVEARDVLFTPGHPRTRWVFARDASGKVTGFADRREGHDVTWTRL